MKILSLHCDYIKFQALKKALKEPEELSEAEKKEKIVKEALVILTAVENGDNDSKELVENIKDLAKQVKAENIVLYPYAHLSYNLSSPQVAVQILKEAEKELKKIKDFKQVVRAPFGYYKEFELKCKGHPLSELARSFGVSAKAKSQEELKQIPVISKEEPIDYKQLLREISKTKLDTSKIKDNDHRIVGKQLDLFSFSDVAPGMVFWHNNGLIVYNELINFWREEHKKAGYQEIRTPQIMDAKLWKVSGHWDKYKENNFITNYENRPFLVKPMNCPGGMLVYKNSPKSYKDLPLRVGEVGTVHRCELSGTLAGLFRIIQFTQDDAHIFCADEKQVKSEILGVMKLIKIIYDKFNLSFDHIELSTRPEKRIGADSIWDMAERILEEVLRESKVKYQINKGDGAFYGPKIDFHVKDSLGRTWQLSTIQLDFALPERFELEYIDKNNNPQRPIMLHRVIYGAVERFLGILLENTNGNLPAWLSPVQIAVVPISEKQVDYAKQVEKQIKNELLRTFLFSDGETLQKRIRDAQLQKIPYIIVVGDKEKDAKKINLRLRTGENIGEMSVVDFLKRAGEKIRDRSLEL